MELTRRPAGFWIRFLANLIDAPLVFLVSWGIESGILWLGYGILILIRGRARVPAFDDLFDGMWLQFFSLGIYFGVAFPYYVWGHYRYGTTLGKKLLGVRVVRDTDLGAISLKRSIARFLGYGPSYVLFFCGFLMAAIHPRKVALHEALSGTASVRV